MSGVTLTHGAREVKGGFGVLAWPGSYALSLRGLVLEESFVAGDCASSVGPRVGEDGRSQIPMVMASSL